MAGDRSPPGPHRPGDQSPGPGQAWTAMGYLIAGILVWGFIGWLIDQWLGLGGLATGIGSLVGAAGGVYLILRRLGG